MKKIQQLKEFLALKHELQEEFAEYLEEEFFGLYEYLSNGEKVEDFILPSYQAMIILEEEEELIKLMKNPIELEFLDEVDLANIKILRIGIMRSEDVQLYYCTLTMEGFKWM
jgi:hypothetical protein